MDADIQPDLERSLRRARWALRAFRLIFYPSAVIIALLLLAARSTGGEPRTVDGDTSQGRTISLALRDGHVIGLMTQIEELCPHGRSHPFAWTADYIGADGRLRERFTRSWSDGVRGNVDLTLRARVDDGVVTGTLRMVEKRPDNYDCDSGAVSFSARAG